MKSSYPNQMGWTFLLVASLAALALWVPGSAADEAIFSVGVARVDVTPSYPIRLNGFGFRRDESEGVTHPIYAKALAFGSDQQRPRQASMVVRRTRRKQAEA